MTLADGSIRNGYTLRILNKRPVERHFTLAVEGLSGVRIEVPGAESEDALGRSTVLAEAAGALGLPETVAFALDAVRELDPDNRNNLLALGEAWLAAGKPTEALKIADEILRLKPTDAEAQNLMRKVEQMRAR